MLAVGFIGHSGVGKTTLMEKVLARLVSRGRSVSVIKSSHHTVDIDTPGKDTYRYRTAGAQEVMLVTSKRWALMKELEEPGNLSDMLAVLDPVDIVLVEGYKSAEGIPRIIVHRKDCERSELQFVPGVVAVATDDETLVVPEGITKLDLNSPGAVANFVVTLKADNDLL